MRFAITFLILFLSISCSSTVSKEHLNMLNGYWEIQEVVFPDGQKKEYRVNPSIDYIELKGLKGFKKKVYPKFDGTYDTSDDAETFAIIEKDGTFLLSFKNALSEWEEQIKIIEENTFSIVNGANVTYTFKRYQPIKIE